MSGSTRENTCLGRQNCSHRAKQSTCQRAQERAHTCCAKLAAREVQGFEGGAAALGALPRCDQRLKAVSLDAVPGQRQLREVCHVLKQQAEMLGCEITDVAFLRRLELVAVPSLFMSLDTQVPPLI